MAETRTHPNIATTAGDSLLQAESAQNIAAILDEARGEFARVGFMEPAVFDADVRQRTEAIAGNHRTSINMTAASFGRMLSVGAHESAWCHEREVGPENISGSSTSQGKSIYEGYFEHRAAVESQLAAYVDDPGIGEPVYAAIASNSGEYVYGACPEYGEVTVILDEAKINPTSTVYTWGDSLIGSLGRGNQNEITVAKTQVLTREDAMTAKAVVDMLFRYNRRFPVLDGGGSLVLIESAEDREQLLSVRAGYVEAVLFQDVTPSMIEAISVVGAMPEVAKAMSAHPELVSKTTFVTTDGDSELVKDYLAARLTVIQRNYESGEMEQHMIEPVRWEELGADISADPVTVQQALVKKAQSLFKPGSELSHLSFLLSANERQHMYTARGLKQVLNTLGRRVRSTSSEQLQHEYDEMLSVQKALYFFEAMAAT